MTMDMDDRVTDRQWLLDIAVVAIAVLAITEVAVAVAIAAVAVAGGSHEHATIVPRTIATVPVLVAAVCHINIWRTLCIFSMPPTLADAWFSRHQKQN